MNTKKMVKSIISYFFFCLVILLTTGCSKEDESNPDEETVGEGYIPTSVIGKKITLYPKIDRWGLEVTITNDSGDALININSQQESIIEPSCFYTLENGSMVLEITYVNLIPSNQGTVPYYYEYTLKFEFLTKHQGTYTGICKHTIGTSFISDQVNGYFVFDSDEKPNPELSANDQIDFINLIGSWERKSSETDWMRFTFDENKTYRQTMQLKTEHMEVEGTYAVDNSQGILQLKNRAGASSGQYRIAGLTKDRLEMQAYIPETGQYAQTIAYNKIINTSPDNINFSECKISEITNSSAQISGYILGEGITFKDRGICFSTKEVPTINDGKVSVNVDVISSTLSALQQGTTYYVCLYAVTNMGTSYGKVTSFKTTGETITNIQLKISELSPSSVILTAKLPDKKLKYGLCYGVSPNPEVTDQSTTESVGYTSWSLSGLKEGTVYYIRPYHVDGTNIIYYKESEIQIETVGKNIILKCSMTYGDVQYPESKYGSFYSDLTFHISYTITPKDTYKLTNICTYDPINGSYQQSNDLGFIKEGSGSMTCTLSGAYGQSTYKLKLESVNTGIVYYSETRTIPSK